MIFKTLALGSDITTAEVINATLKMRVVAAGSMNFEFPLSEDPSHAPVRVSIAITGGTDN